MDIRYKLYPYPVLISEGDDYVRSTFAFKVHVEKGIRELKFSFQFLTPLSQTEFPIKQKSVFDTSTPSSTGLVISRLERGKVSHVLRSFLKDIERALKLPENTISALQGQDTKNIDNRTDRQTITETEKAPSNDKDIPPKEGYCRHCGTHLYKDSRFCPSYGKQILP